MTQSNLPRSHSGFFGGARCNGQDRLADVASASDSCRVVYSRGAREGRNGIFSPNLGRRYRPSTSSRGASCACLPWAEVEHRAHVSVTVPLELLTGAVSIPFFLVQNPAIAGGVLLATSWIGKCLIHLYALHTDSVLISHRKGKRAPPQAHSALNLHCRKESAELSDVRKGQRQAATRAERHAA